MSSLCVNKEAKSKHEEYSHRLNQATAALAFATFIIGTVALHGHIPVKPLGWTVMGIGIVMLGLRIAHWANEKTNQNWTCLALNIFYCLAFIALGIAAGFGALHYKTLSWILIPPSITKFIFLACCLGGGTCLAVRKLK